MESLTRYQGVTNGQNATAIEIKTDLNLLMDCLKCHMDNAAVQRDTLLTTATICSSSEDAQEYFRECGGINFVLDLLTSAEDCKVKIAALYMLVCACEKNVFSQKRLCTNAVFKFLYCQLISVGKTSDSLKRISAFLLLCLVTNNGEGQNLARTSHCLEALLKLFRTSYPIGHQTSGSPGQMWMDSATNCKQLELWTAVTSTLCGCVNNPQNEENQQICTSAAFPTAITIISKTKNPTIIRLLSSFLSLTIANSVNNQDAFSVLGGIDVLVERLHAITEDLLQQPDSDAIQAAVQLANVFVSCITDNDQNHSRLVDLNLVPLLVQLLSMDFIESDIRMKVIITLGHLTENCERSQRQLLESNGLSLLVHIMAENQDEEFNKAAMYLLSSCVDLVSFMEGEGLNTSDNKNILIKTKSSDKRDKARSERDSMFTPLRDTRTIIEDIRGGDKTPNGLKNCEQGHYTTANVVVTSTREDLTSPSDQTSNRTTEAQVIDDLLRQLHEEKSTRERLENEKEALERREEAIERSKGEAREKAEAITKELERQYKEQKDGEEQGAKQEQQDWRQGPESVTSEQPYPAIKHVEQKLDALEKKLQQINSIGKQLADHLVQASQENPLGNGQDPSIDAAVGYKSLTDGHKTASNLPSERNSDQKKNVLTAKQSCDSMNRYSRSLNDSTDRVHTSRNVDGGLTHKPSDQSEFRVPRAPLRRRLNLGASTRNGPNRLFSPSRNVMKRQRCGSEASHPKLFQERSQYESDRESCVSDVTDLSAATDTDKSVTASDMYLLKQAKSTHKQPCNLDDNGARFNHRQSLLAQSAANQSFQKKCSSIKGASFSVPSSRRKACPTQPANSRLVVGKNNTTASKDVFTFSESPSVVSDMSSTECSNRSAFLHVPKCPGCAPPVNRPLLNSRNFLYTLERSHHTCSEHRELQRRIKQDMHQRRMAQTRNSSPESTKSTTSHLIKNLRSATGSSRCPAPFTPSLSSKSDGQCREKMTSSVSGRRKRQEFTPQEIHNLIEGVAKKGKHWNSILWAYKFASGRTSVDLKDKYRRMQAQNYPGVVPRTPLASCKNFDQQGIEKMINYTWRP